MGIVFLLNVPVMALMLVLAPQVLPESHDRDPRPFDLARSTSPVRRSR